MTRKEMTLHVCGVNAGVDRLGGRFAGPMDRS